MKKWLLFILGGVLLLVGIFGLAGVAIGTLGVQIMAAMQGTSFPLWPSIIVGIILFVIILTGIYLTRK